MATRFCARTMSSLGSSFGGIPVVRSTVPPLVSANWLIDNLERSDLMILDASWHMPSSGRSGPNEFAYERIPGASYFDIDVIADRNSKLPHTMPSADRFEVCMSEIGVTEKGQIVVYDTQGIFSACRVWYMLRTFGAKFVSVLDGGFPAYKKAGGLVERGNVSGKYQTERKAFSSRVEKGAIASLDDMMGHTMDDDIQILDARGADRFAGLVPEPRQGIEAGHMPGAYNIPYKTLLRDGCFKPTKELKEIFLAAGVDPWKPAVTTCGSGVTATIINFALQLVLLEEEDSSRPMPPMRMYDGSWTEWGSTKETIKEKSSKL